MINGVCPECHKPAFVVTCGTCGHRGCYNDCERHDCYWVFRERAVAERQTAGESHRSGNAEARADGNK